MERETPSVRGDPDPGPEASGCSATELFHQKFIVIGGDKGFDEVSVFLFFEEQLIANGLRAGIERFIIYKM